MPTIFFAIFCLLHAMVHMLYAGQSSRIFELNPGLVWPDSSWAFSRLLGDETTRLLATVFLVLAALGFAAGGVGLFAHQGWWRPVIVGSAAFSTLLYLLFWDGSFQAWDAKGGIGMLISLAVLVVVLVVKWPA